MEITNIEKNEIIVDVQILYQRKKHTKGETMSIKYTEVQIEKKKIKCILWQWYWRHITLSIEGCELLKKSNHRGRKSTNRKNDPLTSDAKQVKDKDKMGHAKGESQEHDNYNQHKDVNFKLFCRRCL